MDIFGNPAESAENIYYNNNVSALSAENVQDAIDELKQNSSGDTLSSATSIDNQICRYDGTNNKTIQSSLATIDDTGRIYTVNGTSALPSYSFSAETGSGMYFNPAGADSLGFSLGGTSVMTLNPTFVKMNQLSRAPDGDVNAPGYSFTSQTNSGLYAHPAGISISHNGTQVVDFINNGVRIIPPATFPNGTDAVPSINFFRDGSHGFYSGNDIDGDFIATTLNAPSIPFKVYESSIQHTGTANLPNIAYNNTISGLTATTVKTAIDELIPRVFKTNPTDSLIAGTGSGSNITSAQGNILLGTNTGASITSLGYNIMLGYHAGRYLSGQDNVCIGALSGNGLVGQSNGYNNVLIGSDAGIFMTTGGDNVCIGQAAGSTIRSGDSNTMIGQSADVSSEGIFNSIAIGHQAIATVNNECVIGDTNLTHIRPLTTNKTDLGTASVGYKDLYLQGNIKALGTTSNISVSGTNRLTLNSSGASVNGFVDFMQPCAEMYLIDNSTPTTFTNITDFFPVLGTFSWNTDVVHHMDVSTLGIMQATMPSLRTPYHIGVTISFSTVTNNNQDIIFAVYKNGSIVPGSKVQFYASSNSIRYTTAIHCMPVLNEGDYLRVMARNATNTTDVIVHDINFFAMAMSHTLTFTADSYPAISTPAILAFDTVYYTGIIGYSVPTAGQYTYLTTYYPWKAFNQVNGDTNSCALNPSNLFNQSFNGVLGGWIRLNITHIVKVSSYRFSTPFDINEKPLGWRLYSSIDGTTWTLRDTREPFTWNSNGFSGESLINTGVIPLTSFTCKFLVLLITQGGGSVNTAIEEIIYA